MLTLSIVTVKFTLAPLFLSILRERQAPLGACREHRCSENVLSCSYLQILTYSVKIDFMDPSRE